MALFRVVFRFRRLVCLLCLPGCRVWTPIVLSPGREFDLNAHIRIERQDGSSIAFYGPRVVGDSVVAGWDPSPTRPAVALADVRFAEQNRVSKSRTVLAVVGGVAGAVVVLAVVFVVMFGSLLDASGGPY